MNKRNTYNSFKSDAGRPVIARSVAAEWRIACAEALKGGAVVFEIRTRAAHVAWNPGN